MLKREYLKKKKKTLSNINKSYKIQTQKTKRAEWDFPSGQWL